MKGNAKWYLILAVVFLIVGIVILLTGAISRTMAYGDFVFAFVFLGLYTRANKQNKDDNKNE